jgi:hypothetical protein
LIQVENHSRPLWSFQGACGSLRRLKARKPAAPTRKDDRFAGLSKLNS